MTRAELREKCAALAPAGDAPQNRDGEPTKSGRHCPLDTGDDGYD